MDIKKVVPVITIDGPSGTGKGTICHRLATHLGWHCLDSGALYRIVAFAGVKKGLLKDEITGPLTADESSQLIETATHLDVRFAENTAEQSLVFWEGQEISQALRTERCGQMASKIAVIPALREALLNRQRAFAIPPGLVTDGRDMGTVVFREAYLKIFLSASAEERARRRFFQLKDSGNDARLAQVVDELVKRDARDTARAHSPLKPAEDAVLIDTTGLSVDEVFQRVLSLIAERGGRGL